MVNYPLRIDGELKEQLKEMAKRDKRSLNKLIEFILEDYVNNRPSQKKEAK